MYAATDMNDAVSVDTSQEDRVCVSCVSDSEKVVLVHAPHHVNNLQSEFLNKEVDNKADDEACFNGVSSGDLVVVFEGSVFSGETPYMETVVMHNVPPSSTNPGTYVCTMYMDVFAVYGKGGEIAITVQLLCMIFSVAYGYSWV